MNKSFRILALVLALVMSAALFGACADKGTEGGNSTAAPTAEPEPTEEPVIDVMHGEVLDVPYAAEFTVSKVFSKDMVVQRNEHIRVWGWAPESENGKKVSGEFLGCTADALIENGEWVLTFGARMEANANLGNNMRIYTDTSEVVFTDVLVGDVYMVIGQSNVAFSVANEFQGKGLKTNKDEKAMIDDDAPIRLNYNSLGQTSSKYPTRGTKDVMKDLITKTSWKKATKSSIQTFTAIGYFTAQNIVKITGGKVPVGLIEIDGNGLPLGSFLPNEVADKYSDTCETYKEKTGQYMPIGVNNTLGARFMYNHYMYPFEKFAMAGIIWYQGCSDFAPDVAKYFVPRFTDMINYMRGTHNLVNPNFKVYINELPSIYRQPANYKGANGWAFMDTGLIRSVMGGLVTTLSDCYVSVNSGVWNDREYWNSLHPICKMEMGEVLGKLICAVTENTDLAQATGPILDSWTLSDDGKTATLTFKNVGDGLKTCDGGDVKGFMAVYDNYSLSSKDITVKITSSNTITVTSSKAMRGVAYNAVSENYYGEDINLCNSFGEAAAAVLVQE